VLGLALRADAQNSRLIIGEQIERRTSAAATASVNDSMISTLPELREDVPK
jgi:hypothetical protein